MKWEPILADRKDLSKSWPGSLTHLNFIQTCPPGHCESSRDTEHWWCWSLNGQHLAPNWRCPPGRRYSLGGRPCWRKQEAGGGACVYNHMTSSFLKSPDLSHLPQPSYSLYHGRRSPVKLWSKIYLSPHIPNLRPTCCSESSPDITTRERTVRTNISMNLSPLVRNGAYTT